MGVCVYTLHVLLNVYVKGMNVKMMHPLGELHWICNHSSNLELRKALYAPLQYDTMTFLKY